MTAVLGTVELGGTKTLVGVGSPDGELSDVAEIATTSPEETLSAVIEFLAGHEVDAVGIASFGPLQLHSDRDGYGTVLATPKPGWAGTNLISRISEPLGVPVGLDTDVNGAALAEGRWGNAKGLRDHAYITVGTGIGVGVVHEDRVYRGIAHTEIGHIPVSVVDGDDFSGSCPFHGTCLEGVASGRALGDRFGVPPTDLAGDRLERALSLLAGYLGQGLRALAYTFAPERVVVGGGLSAIPGFHEAIRSGLMAALGGYMVMSEYAAETYVVPPALEGRSGLLGGLIIAEVAS